MWRFKKYKRYKRYKRNKGYWKTYKPKSSSFDTYNLSSNRRARKRRLSAVGDGFWYSHYRHTTLYGDVDKYSGN